MATNRKRVMVPHVMDRAGVDLLAAREDIALEIYPAGIDQASLLPLLADVSGIALSATPFRARELAAAPAIAVVARIGVGFDAVEVPALTARKVPLMTAGTSNSTSVAEHALYLMMTLAKRGPAMDALVRQGRWVDRHAGLPDEIAGKTVLILGFGRIGTRSARRAAAMEMTVLIFDPYVSPDVIRAAGYTPVADLDAALPRADFVSIHCPKNAETVGMFDAARLARMRRGAMIVNTARGGIIDEAALAAALTSGHLAGAGLDVLAEEPARPDHPLFKLPQVVLSPHMAGVTVESIAGMARVTAENILSVLDGHPIRAHAVNPEVFD